MFFALLLSLSASFGAIKLIFQDGWLSGALNVDAHDAALGPQ